MPSLINFLQGIPTDHEGGSYIHVPYITERLNLDIEIIFIHIPILILLDKPSSQSTKKYT